MASPLIDEALRWAQLANLVIIPLVILIFKYFRKGLVSDTTLKVELDKRDVRSITVERRVDELHMRIDHLPAAGAFGEMREDVAKISADIGHAQEDIRGLKTSVDRLTEFLMKQGKG